jgi:hypothetical protein
VERLGPNGTLRTAADAFRLALSAVKCGASRKFEDSVDPQFRFQDHRHRPGGSTSAEKTESSEGIVESVSGKTLTISGTAGGGATFKQVFVVDNSTKVVGVGAGTATAAAGGKIAIAELVGKGDRVTVIYHKMGDAAHAAEILMRAKAK